MALLSFHYVTSGLCNHALKAFCNPWVFWLKLKLGHPLQVLKGLLRWNQGHPLWTTAGILMGALTQYGNTLKALLSHIPTTTSTSCAQSTFSNQSRFWLKSSLGHHLLGFQVLHDVLRWMQVHPLWSTACGVLVGVWQQCGNILISFYHTPPMIRCTQSTIQSMNVLAYYGSSQNRGNLLRLRMVCWGRIMATQCDSQLITPW